MKKRLTKLASLGFVATMCVGLLAGCGGSGDGGSSSGKTEIAFGIWDENQRPAMEDLVAAYEEENPDVKVKKHGIMINGTFVKSKKEDGFL